MTRILLTVLVVLLVASGAASAAVAPKPAALLLRAGQVGTGYFKVLVDGGQSLKKPTLDICHETLASEKLRIARDEVGFVKSSKEPAVENQIVVYKPGGAARAMRDVLTAVKRCPKGAVTSGETSITTTISRLHPKGTFLPGAIALGYHASGTVSGRAVSIYAAVVYQQRGNVLSGVYAYGTTLSLRLKAVGRAATQSALNLRRGA